MLFEKIKLEEDEQILLIVHRHWFVFFTRVFGIVFTALTPFVVLLTASSIPETAKYATILMQDFSREFLFFSALWLLGNWMTIAYIWTDHYLDIWVVTDRRIISIDQIGFFVRSIGSFRLERLQDMNIIIPGIFATFFNYGTIEAQTASGSESEFTVHGMPAPRDIKAVILEAADLRMHNMNKTEQENTIAGL